MKNNKLKKTIIALMFALALLMPVQTEAYAEGQQKGNAQEQVLNNDIKGLTKTPVGKKQLAMKFILAMVGVATSSVVLYVGLSMYNKIFKSQPDRAIGLNNLKSPANYKQAFNKFLDVTDWD